MGLLSRFRRERPREPEPENTRAERVLVISDIHLGEDVLDESSADLSRYISALNRELAEFVRAHSVESDTHWHLIANGDLFDFVKLSLAPEELDGEVSTDDNTPETVARKLDRIFEIHRPLFKEFARFVRLGHRLTLIEGNHDAESFFPEVRERFVSSLEALAHRDARAAGVDLDPAFSDRIAFRTWFEADPGRFHIEHGHAYDEWCAFEYNLVPLDGPDSNTLATPLTHTTIPHFARALGDFSTHGIDRMTTWQHLKLFLGMGPRMFWVVGRLYLRLLWEVLGKAGGRGRARRAALAEEQRARLGGLARETSYGLKTLEALDGIRAMPAEYSVAKMICVFHADRLFVIGLALLGLGLGFWLGGTLGWVAAASAGVVGAWVTHLANGNRSGQVWRDLEAAAASIAQITGARYVVFGHSHRPVLLDLHAAHGVGRFGERAYYLNSGSWVTREILRGEEGTGMTFVELGPEGAALKRWRSGGEPELLATTGAEAPMPTPDLPPMLPEPAAEEP
ncbi:MAG: metallophosphoesterase [Myxococcota bacterium]